MILLRNSLLAARGIAACSRVVSRPLSQQQTKAPSKPGFIRRNIQQIANIVIVYITVSYAAYNYKVKLVWDEREREFKETQDKLNRLMAAIDDDKWLAAVETRIKRAGTREKDILKREIVVKIIDSIKPTADTAAAHNKNLTNKGNGSDGAEVDELKELKNGFKF